MGWMRSGDVFARGNEVASQRESAEFGLWYPTLNAKGAFRMGQPIICARDKLARSGGGLAEARWGGFFFLGKVFVDGGGGFAAFGDGPNNKRLTAAHVAGGEDAVNRGHVICGGDVAAIIEGEA